MRTEEKPVDIHTEGLRFPSRTPAWSRLEEPSARPPSLAGTLYLPASASPRADRLPGLVVGHGAGSNRIRHDTFCRTACAQGLAVLSLDFRGHGESGGNVDGPLEYDIYAAVALLESHPLVDPGRIGYRGSSMGGFYGLLAAAGIRLAALALLCPATERVMLAALDSAESPHSQTDGREDLSARLDEQPLRAYLERQDVLGTAENISSPVLLVHARGDDVVPLETSFAIASRLEGETDVIIVPRGDHGTVQASPALHDRVSDWLAVKLARPTARGKAGRKTAQDAPRSSR